MTGDLTSECQEHQEQREALAALRGALADAGIVARPGGLAWVFVRGRLEVASTSEDARVCLTGLLKETTYLISDLNRQQGARESELAALRTALARLVWRWRNGHSIGSISDGCADELDRLLREKETP